MLSLRVEIKTSRLLNGCSNQLSYESFYIQYFSKFTEHAFKVTLRKYGINKKYIKVKETM